MSRSRELGPRPVQVTWACLVGLASQGLVLATLPLTLPIALGQWTSALPESSPASLWWLVLGIDLAMAAVYVVLLGLIWRGSQGARRVFVGLVLVFAVLEVPAAVEMSRSGYGAGLTSLTSTVMDMAAAGLLLGRQAGESFKDMKRERESLGS